MDPVVLHNFLVDLRQMVGAELDEAVAKLGAPPSRDQLATMAMQGLCAQPSEAGGNCWADYPPQLAKCAYSIADAMLAERAKRVTP
jgi:hypothetical protein